MSVRKPVTGRVRRHFSHSQRVAAPPESVFPLLCPVREYDWIPGWDCEIVYTESGVAELGCIFRTDRPADGGLDTWVISHHEAPGRLGFVRVNALRVMQYDIRLEARGEQTVLTWSQTITALQEEGDRWLAGRSEADFKAGIEKMEELLNRFIASSGPSGPGT